MEHRFGRDIDAEYQAWIAGELQAEFFDRYGVEATFAGVILDNRTRWSWDWTNPLAHVLHQVSIGSPERVRELVRNIGGKLHFVLRENEDSVVAESRHDLLEPGDFPFQGAGTYRGYTGGVSGLLSESDWWLFCRLVDKLIELRAEAAKPAVMACKNRPKGNDTKKFLPNDDYVSAD